LSPQLTVFIEFFFPGIPTKNQMIVRFLFSVLPALLLEKSTEQSAANLRKIAAK
jgi:hypothetical protein